MKITKRQLRRIIKEACGLDQAPVAKLPEMIPADDAVMADPDVPSPQDYEMTRQMLDQNHDIVDLGLGMVMDMAGTSCERSTAQGIIDHLQDMLDGPAEQQDPAAAPLSPVAGLEDLMAL
jgi:hypothetical protein